MADKGELFIYCMVAGAGLASGATLWLAGTGLIFAAIKTLAGV